MVSKLQIDNIPNDLYREIQKYLNNATCFKVSRISKRLHYPFLSYKWRHVIVIGDYFSSTIISRNKEIVRMDVFINPSKYSWFLSEKVEQIDFIWDAFGDIVTLGKLSSSVNIKYPILTQFNFKSGGDYTKLFFSPEFTESFRQFCQKITSVSIQLLYAFEVCKSRQNGSYPHKYNAPLNLDCSGINVNEMFLNLGGGFKFNMLNLECGIQKIFFSSEKVSYNSYVKFCKSLSKLPYLNSLVAFHYRYSTIKAMTFLPHGINKCQLVIASTRHFEFGASFEGEIMSIPQVNEITAISSCLDQQGLSCSLFSLPFWKSLDFPNLGFLRLTPCTNDTKQGYSFSHIPRPCFFHLTSLSVALEKISNFHAFIFNLPTMYFLEHLELTSWNLMKLDLGPRSGKMIPLVNFSIKNLLKDMTKDFACAHAYSHYSPNICIRGHPKKKLREVINSNSIKDKWTCRYPAISFSSQLISEILENPVEACCWFFTILEKAGLGGVHNLNSKNLFMESFLAITFQQTHSQENNSPPGEFPIDNSETNFSDFNYVLRKSEELSKISPKALLIDLARKQQKLDCFDLPVFRKCNVSLDDVEKKILFIASCSQLLFSEAIFDILPRLPHLKTLDLGNSDIVFSSPRVYNMVWKHKTLSLISANIQNYCMGERSPYMDFTLKYFMPYAQRQYVFPVVEFPLQHSSNGKSVYSIYRIDAEGIKKGYARALVPSLSKIDNTNPLFNNFMYNEDIETTDGKNYSESFCECDENNRCASLFPAIEENNEVGTSYSATTDRRHWRTTNLFSITDKMDISVDCSIPPPPFDRLRHVDLSASFNETPFANDYARNLENHFHVPKKNCDYFQSVFYNEPDIFEFGNINEVGRQISVENRW